MWTWTELKRILMRKSKADISNLGAIMVPVVYPVDEATGATSHIPADPHITIHVFEDINDPGLGFTKEDIMDVVDRTLPDVFTFMAQVEEIDWFGESKDIPVARVWHPMLLNIRKQTMAELDRRGIEYSKRFPVFKPHVTVTEEAVENNLIPEYFWTQPVEVWWGGAHYRREFDGKWVKYE